MTQRQFSPLILLLLVVASACHSVKETVESPAISDAIYEVVPADFFQTDEPAPPKPKPKGGYVRSTFQSKTKGEVNYIAYLPPGWKAEDTTTSYPLLVYLYGQGGNEYSFARVVTAKQLDSWINADLVEPMVIICVRGEELIPGKTWDKQKIQWYTSDNEALLLEEEGELREYCRNTLHAGMTSDQIALEGHSRGATGTLHFALKHPGKFSSYLANCYVSDYTLSTLKSGAKRNKSKIISEEVPLRMEIGTADFFEEKYGRRGTHLMHDYLTALKIPHEYDTIPGANHHYYYIWNYQREGLVPNGLTHLKFHEKHWNKQDSLP